MAKQQIVLTLAEWIALTTALEASPDISANALARKAARLVESRTKYGREVHRLEQQLLDKCPDLDK